MAAEPLLDSFAERIDALGLDRPGTRLLVALSGGCDSVVLLHLLRFGAPGVDVCAAHFDHAMREGSRADANWVMGLCEAWGVPLLSERARVAPRNETEARSARHDFFRRAAAEMGATHLATAHHADDQAETVLFRILRGTGPAGVVGIAPLSAACTVRPLLPFWRTEIRRYARQNGLRWREDPTNRCGSATRNRIRRHILPLLERTVASGARRNLVRLAELSAEDEASWEALLGGGGAEVRREGGALLVASDLFRDYDGPVAARVLRSLLRHFGVVLDRTGTRLALQFIMSAPSGREIRLAGSLRMSTEFGVVRIEPIMPPPGSDHPLALPGPQGEGCSRIGGRELRARWREGAPPPPAPSDAEACIVSLDLSSVRFPLLLRGWRAGDRIRTPAGTKKLKKLFGERRIPRSARAGTPVLTAADGRVLWVAGVELAADLHPVNGRPVLHLTIIDD